MKRDPVTTTFREFTRAWNSIAPDAAYHDQADDPDDTDWLDDSVELRDDGLPYKLGGERLYSEDQPMEHGSPLHVKWLSMMTMFGRYQIGPDDMPYEDIKAAMISDGIIGMREIDSTDRGHDEDTLYGYPTGHGSEESYVIGTNGQSIWGDAIARDEWETALAECGLNIDRE